MAGVLLKGCPMSMKERRPHSGTIKDGWPKFNSSHCSLPVPYFINATF